MHVQTLVRVMSDGIRQCELTGQTQVRLGLGGQHLLRISSPAALVTAGRPRVPDIVKAYNRKVRARAKEEKKSESNASENPTKRRRIV